MEIRDMTIDDIQMRMDAIKEEMDVEGADLDALEAEVTELNARKAELKEQAEERKAEAKEAAENGEIVKTFKENVMEERTFTPDSVEYRDAYLKSLMGKSLSMEERTALTVTEAGGENNPPALDKMGTSPSRGGEPL